MRAFLLSLLLSLAVSGVSAQTAATYTSDDGTFSFQYPAVWAVEPASENAIRIYDPTPPANTVDFGGIQLRVVPPEPLAAYSMTGRGDSPRAIITASTTLDRVLNIPSVNVGTEPTLIDTTINERPATYAIAPLLIGSVPASLVYLVLDVGGESVVTVQATLPSTENADFAPSLELVLQIAESMVYAPPEPTADYLNTFSAPTSLDTGTITFGYPADWYAVNAGALVLQNSALPINREPLESGAVQVFIADPDFNALLFTDMAAVQACDFERSAVTPTAVAQMILERENLTDASIRQFEREARVIAEKDAVLLRITTDDTDRLLILIELTAGEIAVVSATAPAGELAQHEDDLLVIAATMTYAPVNCPAETDS